MSQPAFAALAGASKGAQQNWERDAASPNAIALIAFAEAGADVLYVLTGRRTNEGPDLSHLRVSEEIARARAALLDPSGYARPGETTQRTEERVVQHQIEILSLILGYQNAIGTPEELEEARSLLNIANDPQKLIAFRAADHAQLRSKRKRLREAIISYIEMNDRQPNHEAINRMVGIALDYNVPIGPLVELALELLGDPNDEQ